MIQPIELIVNKVPTINAENKTIKVGDKFNPLTGITANDKEDGNITDKIKVVENTVNTNKAGTYTVKYEVTDSEGATATKTITVTVKSNDKPVINGADNVSIKEGTAFDPMAGVTATDTEGGNITKDIKITGNVDVNKPGKYELIYTVTDSDGNTTTVKRVIIVNPKMVEINSRPTINAENKTIKVGDKFDPMAGVTATDTEDGNITKDIKITGNVDVNKPGKYELIYTVTDGDGNTTTIRRVVTVMLDSIKNDTNSSQTENKSEINKNNANSNNVVNTNKPSSLHQLNQIETNNNSNPQTGDTGNLGYIVLVLESLLGLVINRIKHKK